MSTLDAAIETAARIVIGHLAAEGEAQEALLLLRLIPQVDACERIGLEGPRGFLERLANDCGDELFTAFDVTGRLIEDHRVADPLFDEQELAIAFNDCGYGEVGS